MSWERIQVYATIGSVEVLRSREDAPYVEMRVCAERQFGTTKQSIWYKVLMFGYLAKDGDALKARYTPGRQVIVEGRQQNEAYRKTDGSPGLDQAIIAISMPELKSWERSQICGNIGSVEVKRSREQTPYIEMRVCVDRHSGGSKQAIWYKVLMFGTMARDGEALKSRYTVGRQVIVEGRPQNEAYKKADGSPGLDQAIIAISMPELVGFRQQAKAAQAVAGA